MAPAAITSVARGTHTEAPPAAVLAVPTGAVGSGNRSTANALRTRWRKLDPDAVTVFRFRHAIAAAMRRAARSRAHDGFYSDWEDLVQDFFVALLEGRISIFVPPEHRHATAYVARCAYRFAVGRIRTERRRQALARRIPPVGLAGSTLPSQLATLQLHQDCSSRDLDLLHRLELGCSVPAIAKDLGVSTWAIYKRSERLRARILGH